MKYKGAAFVKEDVKKKKKIANAHIPQMMPLRHMCNKKIKPLKKYVFYLYR